MIHVGKAAELVTHETEFLTLLHYQLGQITELLQIPALLLKSDYLSYFDRKVDIIWKMSTLEFRLVLPPLSLCQIEGGAWHIVNAQ